jgi:hypothetical protein
MKLNEKALKGVAVLSVLIFVILSMITVVYADHAGWAEWYNPDTSAWEPINPSPDHLKLLPEDLPIEIRICGLSSFIGKTIQIKVSNEDWFYSSDRVQLITGDCSNSFWWPDPDHPFDYEICTTYVVQFREFVLHPSYDPPKVYVASGIIGGDNKPAHIHVIPEFAFGTVMSILSLLSGLGLYSKFRKP